MTSSLPWQPKGLRETSSSALIGIVQGRTSYDGTAWTASNAPDSRAGGTGRHPEVTGQRLAWSPVDFSGKLRLNDLGEPQTDILHKALPLPAPLLRPPRPLCDGTSRHIRRREGPLRIFPASQRTDRAGRLRQSPFREDRRHHAQSRPRAGSCPNVSRAGQSVARTHSLDGRRRPFSPFTLLQPTRKRASARPCRSSRSLRALAAPEQP